MTGGGRGIGANIARELAGAGARVAVAARSHEQVEEVAGEVDGLALELDVTDRSAVERAIAEVERELGPLDLLAANAGTMLSEPEGGWVTDPDDWWRVFEVNVLGVYLCCRAVIPGMLERGRGRIVITGFVISPGLVKTEMTKRAPDDAPWTPPELAPRLVRALASGRADALAGRYIHAEHDDIDDLIARADEIESEDLNAIRLRR